MLADIPRLVALWRFGADTLGLLNRHFVLIPRLAVKVGRVLSPASGQVSVVLRVGDDHARPRGVLINGTLSAPIGGDSSRGVGPQQLLLLLQVKLENHIFIGI
jgi:hypothetical protein